MPFSTVNGVCLYWEQHGRSGPPLVLVHGSWGDHTNWARVVPALARSFRVLTYDRRGHSESERPAAQGSIRDDVEDLAALIRDHGMAPAHVAGNSFGAAITLRLAATQPDLLASAVAHEPPLMMMLQGQPLFAQFQSRMAVVVEALRAGQDEEGAREFVERVALGPGSWDRMSEETRRVFVANAPTFLDETNEADSLAPVGFERLASFPRPMLLTDGTTSPVFFAPIVRQLEAMAPQAQRHTFQGAGHIPQATHPDDYVSVVTEFVNRAARQLV